MVFVCSVQLEQRTRIKWLGKGRDNGVRLLHACRGAADAHVLSSLWFDRGHKNFPAHRLLAIEHNKDTRMLKPILKVGELLGSRMHKE